MTENPSSDSTPSFFQESTALSKSAEELAPITSAPLTSTPTTIPADVISTDNITEIEITHRLFPFNPPIISISGDQKVIAAGDLTGVHVYHANTQNEIRTIDVRLPDCRFGWDTFLALDHTGKFIAFASYTGIEVWQVDGGRIYQSAYDHGLILDPLTCGLDIPQFALSPGGKYLAESGFGMGGDEYGDYFRVIDILNNEVVYEWNGEVDSLHGQLQTFQELGFSSDGKVLQTFDPMKYQGGSSGRESFLFWSTDDWQRIESGSEFLKDSIDSGNLYFSISDRGRVAIIDKLSGTEVVEVEMEGCTLAFPCPTIFSPDGMKFGILKPSLDIQYKRELLITEIDIFSIKTNNKLNTKEVLIRNKSAIRLADNGEIVSLEYPKKDNAKWWSHTAYLNGLFLTKNGEVGFSPQVWDVFNRSPHYSGTCFLELADNTVYCEEGLRQADGNSLSVEQIANGFVLVQNGVSIAQMKYPAGTGSDVWQIRLKAYNSKTGVGYFCLDRNLREETCVVMNFPDNKIALEQVDLFGFSHSNISNLSVFIDREIKELNIFYEDSGRTIQMHSYKAIAYPLKPALVNGSPRSFYIVQNVENGELYVEEVDLEEAKVIRRYTFDELVEITPRFMAVNNKGNLLAVSDNAGSVHFFNLLENEFVHAKKISQSQIVDMLFSADDRSLIIMEDSGEIGVLQVLQ